MKKFDEGKPNPLKRISLWSRATFGFVEPLLRKGFNGARIEPGDVFQVAPEERSDVLCSRLEMEWSKEWTKHQRGQTASFTKAVARALGMYYVFSGIFAFIEDFSRLLQPVFFSWLLDYMGGDSDIGHTQAWMYALGIGGLSLISSVAGPQIVQHFCVSANRWQFASYALIYRKLLRLSRSRLSDLTTGHIVDLINKDTRRFHHIIWNIHGLWLGPLKGAFAFWFMYRRLGGAIAVGYLVILVLGPIQACIAKVSSQATLRMEQVTDKRVQLMTEIITGMRVIKMYCWEKPFGKLLSSLRQSELDQLWIIHLFCTVISELYTFNFRLVATSVIVAAVLLGYDIKASTVFPMFAMFSVINESLLNLTSWGVKTFFEFGVSAKRIQSFLLSDEKENSKTYVRSSMDNSTALNIREVTAKWDKHQEGDALKDVSIVVRPGQLVAVVGQVGAGKSSLLNLIADEMLVTSGSVHLSGDLSYSAQQPWIFSDTIRGNVLLGKEYQPLVFQEVINVTGLTTDLESLRYGDLTRVGDRGVTLSGGQKARLGLARALYQQADIYLLDDPLSAVDTVVGRHIFDRAIKEYLGRKTRILVTHQLQYLKEVDHIIVMDKGRIVKQGTFQELHSRGLDFAQFLRLPSQHEEDLEVDTQFKRVTTTDKMETIGLTEEEMEEEEERSTSQLGWDAYKQYFKSKLGCWEFLVLIFLNVLCQLSYNGTDWWLATWIRSDSVSGTGERSMKYYLLLFILLTLSVYIVGLVRGLVFRNYMIGLSKHHHDKMYTSVIRSPNRFFDSNPSGRILNRFSSDLDVLDTFLSDTLYDFIQQIMILLGSLLFSLYLCPILLIPAALLFAFLYRTRAFFLHGQKGYNLLESVARSPMLTYLKSSIEGIDTIRALGRQRWCVEMYDDLSETLHSRIWTGLSLYNWYNFRMNMTVATFTCCSMVAYMMARDHIDPTLLAMSLSYLVPIMWYLNTTGRLSVDLGTSMVQVERVLNYSQLPPEAPLDLFNRPPTWPKSGSIIFEKVTFKYHSDGPEILKGISFSIRSGEKIGIAGRTGAGKSSLIQSLFRMAECKGTIYIDGVDASSLGLHHVRGNISIIPQDPILFSGPVRRNLDPFNEYTDHKIWQALKEVQMSETIEELTGALDSPVKEGGANFSVGQRQLLCLARAILKHNQILVMDEATANVDSRTDELIQQAIRRAFQSCTVLTVAHRLNTIMDSDRIMVIASGRVAEFDSSNVLLQNRNSALSALVAETGPSEERRLRHIAEEAFKQKSTFKVS